MKSAGMSSTSDQNASHAERSPTLAAGGIVVRLSVDLDRSSGDDIGPASGLELGGGRGGDLDRGAVDRYRPGGLQLHQSAPAGHRNTLLCSHLDLAAFQLQVARR